MRKLLQGLVVPLFILIGWHLVCAGQYFSPYLLPAPEHVWSTAWELLASGVLVQHLLISLQRVCAGFFISCCLAIPLGILCGQYRLWRDFCWPLLEFLRHVPPLAAVPLIILWAGIGEGSKITIIVLASFFPLFLNTYSGIANCDRGLLEVGQTLNLSRWQLIRRIRIPAALESIAVGLQLALGYSWRALIGAELIAASAGIGYLILDAEEMSRPDIVIVGMLALGIIGSLVDALAFKVLAKIFPWRRSL